MRRLILCTLTTIAVFAPAASGQHIKPADGHLLIPWTDTPQYPGRSVVVYGKVVAAKDTGRRTYLNFHEDYKNHLTIVVNKDAYGNFPGSPEKLYGGKNVVVYGMLNAESSRPEMYLGSSDQITIAPDDDAALASFARSTHPGAHSPDRLGRTGPRNRGRLRIGTYNVLNLFDESDDPYRADEVMRPKPRDQMQRVAERIRQLDADVLALQEVENRYYLQRFVDTFLPDMGYEHVVLIEANNHRGIDCAVLSRVPVGPVTTYQHVSFEGPDGKTYRFQRDLLRVTVEPKGAEPIEVFSVHLKSKYGGAEISEPVRQAEALQMRRLVDQILARNSSAHFVICGDFNDLWDSPSLKIIRGSGANELTCPGTALDEAKRVTYNREPYRSMIDFIMCSPAMAQSYIAGSYAILPGTVDDSGSDHNPSVATFKFRTTNY
jgi:endonuclease/exonuclease/phosphatase family metal-dependent hydrolase